jgi:hypothetical protein
MFNINKAIEVAIASFPPTQEVGGDPKEEIW